MIKTIKSKIVKRNLSLLIIILDVLDIIPDSDNKGWWIATIDYEVTEEYYGNYLYTPIPAYYTTNELFSALVKYFWNSLFK